ncbi:papain-like cysteine protease family protein [Streptomyces sp. 796.1]|uniref:papain-like cysteine protease family protein n=1 Tax=Streptomyces sp. 796.1 TaxID=3163029 RepID=UPI0039C93FF2
MPHLSALRRRRARRPLSRRLSAVALASVALLAAPTVSVSAAEAAPRVQAANVLDVTMQAQQKSNWCWAASGNTIATWMGRNYSQNQFCNAAFNRQQGFDCPNNQATLGNVQNALRWAGIRPGSYVDGWLQYGTVQNEINARRPIETRIQWSSGGGHMHVIYGYDNSNGFVYWGDPWPSNNRYNWATHNWYINNNQHRWTHSLYQIGA